eukprot:TRINITY_DN71239_c0_g1_i1.p1 TRINITY_DN71239_c0_g1~~TRINITY_DN71239_c0_g1_i1.p1  ORF type:complete len:336 (+),score=53.62 TRINITY_DN71239_c0_g1_i1:55-1062(+)
MEADRLSFGLESEEGCLWNTIKRQLYKPEVAHIKRLVGESYIQQNRLLWDELLSLRQMFEEFQGQNDQLLEQRQAGAQVCKNPHRDLLRKQAITLMQDLCAQTFSENTTPEDLVPELREKRFRDFLSQDLEHSRMPQTPSTRSSSSSGFAAMDLINVPSVPLGRALDVDELVPVADSIREALMEEHDMLSAAIHEQMQRLMAEDARRLVTSRGEPTNAELQSVVHKLQEAIVSPKQKLIPSTNAFTQQPGTVADAQSNSGSASLNQPMKGCANVQRIRALIAQRRKEAAGQVLDALPEDTQTAQIQSQSGAGAALAPASIGNKASFDPFFDDPFA